MNGSRTIRFPLAFRLHRLRVNVDHNVPVARPFLDVRLATRLEPQVDCFVDTGSAVSVVSWPVHEVLSWKRIPTSFEELKIWNGQACDFGETTIRLFDREHRFLSPALPVVGKFLKAPTPFHKDRFIILGLSFLMDNAARLEISGQPWNLAGHLELPE